MLMSELPSQQAILSFRTFSEIIRIFPGLIHTFLFLNFELSLVVVFVSVLFLWCKKGFFSLTVVHKARKFIRVSQHLQIC